jgi:hypothetical protein
MKKGKRKPIKYSGNRVVLSDTLPYETPIIFSNRHFYNFLNLNKVEIKTTLKSDGKKQSIVWNSDHTAMPHIIRLLFHTNPIRRNNSLEITKNELRNIPFCYKIRHKENGFRELSIPHPKNQLELVEFYDKYKELIIFHSKQSRFSLRKPENIAKYVYINDSLNKELKGDEYDVLEMSGKEYESLKSYFTYKEYSNVFQFYEDYRYHNAEKKYDKMFTFDIAKCFDSIYTHSIAWALYNKDFIKEAKKKSENTFAGQFDAYMQNVNDGETNGIIIGPEFSRIFAEIILQRIDKHVEKVLSDKNNLKLRTDYEVFRYVDDYFVFYNDDKSKEKILEAFTLKLKEYKMSINETKIKYYTKPLITDITIAKEKITGLLKDEILFNYNTSSEDETDPEATEVDLAKDFPKLEIRFSSNHIIRKFKSVLSESNVKYIDVMNYTLEILNRIVESNINTFEKQYKLLVKKEFLNELNIEEEQKKNLHEHQVTNYFQDILSLVFFLYTVSPRINSTLKLCHILSKIISFFDRRYKITNSISATKSLNNQKYTQLRQFNPVHIELVYKRISDEITLVLKKNQLQEFKQLETLYLFIPLRELGKNYRLTESQLSDYLQLKPLENDASKYQMPYEPNYFLITILLFYIRRINEFKGIQVVVKEAIRRKIQNVAKSKRSERAEFVLLLFDLLACPFLDNKFKREMLRYFGIQSDMHDTIIQYKNVQKYWFTKWDNFNFAKELRAKKSLEPYS